MAVRGYRHSDRRQVEVVLRSLGWEERFVAGQLQAVDHLAETSTGAVFVEAHAGSFRGFAAVELHEWNGLAQLQGLAVGSGYRRRGVGSALVTAAERFARNREARGIYLDTPVDNSAGRAFYDRLGYAADYVMSRYYADEVDGVTYVRFLE